MAFSAAHIRSQLLLLSMYVVVRSSKPTTTSLDTHSCRYALMKTTKIEEKEEGRKEHVFGPSVWRGRNTRILLSYIWKHSALSASGPRLLQLDCRLCRSSTEQSLESAPRPYSTSRRQASSD